MILKAASDSFLSRAAAAASCWDTLSLDKSKAGFARRIT